jgi:Fucose-binding lectin II (PA-IIL)
MNFPNPYTTRIPSDSNYNFSFTSNAAYFQRATVSVNGQVSAVFNGSGENVAMTQQGGSTSYGGATRQAMTASILFEYSSNGSDYSQSSVAQAWSTSTLVMVGTEDSTDNDNNDTVMTLSFTSL